MEVEMTAENIDRRAESVQKLHTLLESRADTLVLYNQLAGFRPFDAKLELRELLEEFCESLVDYTASAHFQLYRFIAEGIERRKSVKELADKVYPHISSMTQKILDFNDKYEKATEQEFRQQCLQAFTDHKALDFMFDQVKAIALQHHEGKGEATDDLTAKKEDGE